MPSQAEELIKELLPDLNERQAVYDDIADAIIQGIQVSPEEIAVLVWGLFRDNKVQPTLGYNEIEAELKNAEKVQPGSTQLNDFTSSAGIVDTTFSDNTFTKGLTLLLAARSLRGFQAKTGTAFPRAGILDRLKALGGNRLLRGTAILGAGTLIGTALFSDTFESRPTGPGEGLPPDGVPIDSPQDDLNPIIVFDPNTQTTTRIDPRTLDPLQDNEAVGGVGGGYSQDLDALAAGLNIDLSSLGGALNQEALNQLILGDITVPPSKFPFGAGEQGQPLGAGGPSTFETGTRLGPEPSRQSSNLRQNEIPLRGTPLQKPILGPKQPGPTGPVQGPSLESPTGLIGDLPVFPEERRTETVVPPGAQINPRAFQAVSGRSFIQMVAEAAARYQVPVEILYGIINQESGFNPNAVGDQGRSFGLGQIFLPAHPTVTQAQALNPAFAINWTAANLIRHFKQFGSWEAALMAHRSPAGAAHFVKTGEFKTKRDRSYLTSVLNFAAGSGIGNQAFDFDALGSVPLTPAPIALPPFVEPDRAQLRNFIRNEFKFLERDPTTEELASGEEKLIGFFREAHDVNVQLALGSKKVEEVQPEERFREELRGSGEGLFREETRDTRTMFDFMGQLSTVLRQA